MHGHPLGSRLALAAACGLGILPGCRDDLAPAQVALSVESAPLGEIPHLRQLSPTVVAPGTRVRLVALGSALDGATAIRVRHRLHPWLHLPVHGPVVPGDRDAPAFDLDVPLTAGRGDYEVVLVVRGTAVLASVPLVVRPPVGR